MIGSWVRWGSVDGVVRKGLSEEATFMLELEDE